MRAADREHRARQPPDHVPDSLPALARAADRVLKRQVEHDLVAVAVAGGSRPRSPAIAHPPKRIPRQHKHAQPRRNESLTLSQARAREAQLQQRPLALGHGHKCTAQLLPKPSERIHHARGR
jgi:hypothetical protein